MERVTPARIRPGVMRISSVGPGRGFSFVWVWFFVKSLFFFSAMRMLNIGFVVQYYFLSSIKLIKKN